MKRLFWNIDYCDGPVFRIWWLGYFQVAKWRYLPWYRGWMVNWNTD